MNKDDKTIAKYMGLEPVQGNYYHEVLGKARITVWMKPPTTLQAAIPCLYSQGQKNYKFKHSLRYSKSWSELIYVVKKIKTYKLPTKASKVDQAKHIKLLNEVRRAYLQCKLMPLYLAVVDYIDFINRQKS